jgi:hypothetical protein
MSSDYEVRMWGRREPVKVFLSGDISGFVQSLNAAAAAFARFAETWTPQSRARAAFGWLERHLDEVYASLDIPRDPNITRGEN